MYYCNAMKLLDTSIIFLAKALDQSIHCYIAACGMEVYCVQ